MIECYRQEALKSRSAAHCTRQGDAPGGEKRTPCDEVSLGRTAIGEGDGQPTRLNRALDFHRWIGQ